MIEDIRLDGEQPLQHQLYQRLSERILNQRYLPGRQLPPSRQMAKDLGISRNTVNAVYEQLKAEGFLQSRAGKGFFVHEDIKSVVKPSGPGLKKAVGVGKELPPLPARPSGKSKPVEDASLPFQPGLPDLDAFPIRAWNRIMHHQESRRSLRGYDSIQGFQPLRRAIAAYLRTS
ncbi:MAG: GntR family transcriptional regulator, partial [Marinobacter sp.]|nr:GntR family transcriptional regulator [Marinobacter sp.]